jgi:hypothetical protein
MREPTRLQSVASGAWKIWGPIASEAQAFYDEYSDEQLTFLLDFLRGAEEFLARHRTRVEARGVRGEAASPAPDEDS